MAPCWACTGPVLWSAPATAAAGAVFSIISCARVTVRLHSGLPCLLPAPILWHIVATCLCGAPHVIAPLCKLQGLQDEVIDVAHGRQLHKLCPRPSEPLWAAGRGHQDLEASNGAVGRRCRHWPGHSACASTCSPGLPCTPCICPAFLGYVLACRRGLPLAPCHAACLPWPNTRVLCHQFAARHTAGVPSLCLLCCAVLQSMCLACGDSLWRFGGRSTGSTCGRAA
jgi:hypothetical protein